MAKKTSAKVAKKAARTPDQIAAAKAAKAQADQASAARTVFGPKGMAAGSWASNKFFAPGSMGRISTGIQMTDEIDPKTGQPTGNKVPVTDAQGNPQRIGENQDVLNRYQDLSKGLSADQYQAAREQQMKGVQSGLATTMQGLAKAQAQGKVYGAAGAAQQANALQGYQNKTQDIEQQNKLQDVNLIREGTDKYAGALAGQQKSEREGAEFNLGQVASEKAGQASTFMDVIAANHAKNLTNKSLDIAQAALGATQKKSGGGGTATATTGEPTLTPKPGATPAPRASSTPAAQSLKASPRVAKASLRRQPLMRQ